MDTSGNGNGHPPQSDTNLQNIPSDYKGRGPKFPREVVRERRRLVEEMMLIPCDSHQIWLALKNTYPVDARTFREDIKLVRRFWKVDDKRRSDRRREDALRRYERKMRKTESEGRWAANHAFEILWARVAGILEAPPIQFNQTNILEAVTVHSRVNIALATLPKDERRKLAESLANAERGHATEARIVQGIPERVVEGEATGVESGGAALPAEGGS